MAEPVVPIASPGVAGNLFSSLAASVLAGPQATGGGVPSSLPGASPPPAFPSFGKWLGAPQGQGAAPPPPPAPGVEGATWLAGQQLNAAIQAQDARRSAALDRAPNQFSVARQMAERIPTGQQLVQSQLSGASGSPGWVRGGVGGFG